MSNYSYPYPFLPISGNIIDGSSSKVRFRDLTDMAGSISVGIYDNDTQSIATGSGNGKKFFIGYSSEHTKDFLDKFVFGATLGRGNTGWSFKGTDVLAFEYSDPTYLKNERWVIGWSGSDGCNNPLPKFERGKRVGVKIRAYGNEVTKQWNGDFIREYWSDDFKPLTDPSSCTGGVCPPEYVNPDIVLKTIASKINKNQEAQQLFIKARVTSSNYTSTSANMFVYELIITDDGSNNALAAVQRTVPSNFTVKRVGRSGLVSVYNVCALTLPTAFQPDHQGAFASDCNGCNEVLSNATYFDVYQVTKTVAAATDIDTEAKRTTVINTATTSYSGTVGTYVSHSGTTLVFTFRKAKGSAAPTPAGSDVIDAKGQVFTLVMPSTVAWTQKCDAYRMQRTLCITLPRKDCTVGNRLEELKAFYANVANVNSAGITVTAGTNCEDTYQMVQYSNTCMTDTCLAADTAVYDEIGGYENAGWKPVVANVTYDAAIKAGLEISVNVPKTFIPDEEYDPWTDEGDKDPIRLEVSFVYEPLGEFPAYSTIPIAKRVSTPNNIRQSGFSTLRNYIKSSVYKAFGEDYCNPQMRRVLDSNLRKQVDRNSSYRYYYLKVKIDRNNSNWSQQAEIAEFVFTVPVSRPDKMLKLESAILAPLSKFGVVLNKRA